MILLAGIYYPEGYFNQKTHFKSLQGMANFSGNTALLASQSLSPNVGAVREPPLPEPYIRDTLLSLP